MTWSKTPLLTGIAVALLGATVLVGRILGNAALISVVPGNPTVRANAAFALLLCGAALAISSRRRVTGLVRLTVTIIAGVVFLVAALTLSQDLFDWNLGIDQWLVRDPTSVLQSSAPGRMPPSAAYSIMLVAGALAVANWRFKAHYQLSIVTGLAATATVIGTLGLIAHGTSGEIHTLVWNYAAIPPATALSVLLLGLALIALVRHRHGFAWSLSAFTLFGFAAGAAVLLTTTLYSSRSLSGAHDDISAVAASLRVLTEIEEVEANLFSLEADQRAFVINGERRFVERQSGDIADIRYYIASLRKLTAGDVHHQQRLDRLVPLFGQHLERAERAIAAYDPEGPTVAAQLMAAEVDTPLPEAIQELREEMEDHEYAVLGQKRLRAEERHTEAFLQLPLGFYVGLTLLALGLMLLDEGTRTQRRTEKILRASETRLRLFVANAPAAIAMLDREMRYLVVSRRWLTDYRIGDRDIVGRSHYEVFPDIPERWKAVHRRCLAGAVEKNPEDPFPRADGGIDWVRWEIHPWRDNNGEIGGILLLSELINERVEATRKIAKLNRVHAVLSSINALIVRVRNREQLFSEACRIAVEEGKFAFAWIGIDDRAAKQFKTVAWAGAEELPCAHDAGAEEVRDRQPVVINLVQNDGRVPHKKEHLARNIHSMAALPIIVSSRAVGVLGFHASEPMYFDDAEVKLLSELAGDIAFALQTIEKQEKLDYVSYNDALTELPNRGLFIDRAKQWLATQGTEMGKLALILLNIERFRNINETFGRQGGDELLQLVARRLEKAFQGKDTLSRVGADVFGVLLRGVQDTAAVAHVIEDRVQGCFKSVYAIGGKELRVAVKAGVAVFPGDGSDADTLFNNAEAALKKARDSDDRYLFYSSDMNARAAQALLLETRLRRAVEAREFVLYYRPKIDLATRRICGVEALIRWQTAEGELLLPEIFRQTLEDTGLIVEVGKWSLEQALDQHRDWKGRGCRPPRIAVNISALQVERKNFADVVMGVIQDAGDDPDALELEITENLLMKDTEASVRKLTILRGLGIDVTVDHFGTGYSVLSSLARLPITSLKVDRSFILGMADNPQDFAIITTIIALGHALKLRVAADGIDTEQKANLLKLLNCDEGQGALFGTAMPAAQMETLLRANAAKHPGSHGGAAE